MFHRRLQVLVVYDAKNGSILAGPTDYQHFFGVYGPPLNGLSDSYCKLQLSTHRSSSALLTFHQTIFTSWRLIPADKSKLHQSSPLLEARQRFYRYRLTFWSFPLQACMMQLTQSDFMSACLTSAVVPQPASIEGQSQFSATF